MGVTKILKVMNVIKEIRQLESLLEQEVRKQEQFAAQLKETKQRRKEMKNEISEGSTSNSANNKSFVRSDSTLSLLKAMNRRDQLLQEKHAY